MYINRMLVYDMTINGKTCHDISEIFLKLALSINQSINQPMEKQYIWHGFGQEFNRQQ